MQKWSQLTDDMRRKLYEYFSFWCTWGSFQGGRNRSLGEKLPIDLQAFFSKFLAACKDKKVYLYSPPTPSRSSQANAKTSWWLMTVLTSCASQKWEASSDKTRETRSSPVYCLKSIKTPCLSHHTLLSGLMAGQFQSQPRFEKGELCK